MNLKVFTCLKRTLFLSAFIPIVVLANANSLLLSSHHYSLAFDIGLAIPANVGNATTFQLGYSTYSYSSNTQDDHNLIVGVALSKIILIDALDTLQWGASIYFLSSMDAKGNLAQGISPPYYQSSYSYNIKSYQYLIHAKLSRKFYEYYYPYIYMGLGLANNKAYHYSTAIPDYLTVTPEFSDRATNAFTYSLGLGMDYFVKPNVSIGLAYRFINLGKVGLGSGVIRNTPVPAKLTLSHLYLNTFVAQLNYFI